MVTDEFIAFAKDKWIPALRDPSRYLQTNHQIRAPGEAPTGYRYCCLGVACHLIDPQGFRGIWFEHGDEDNDLLPPSNLSASWGWTNGEAGSLVVTPEFWKEFHAEPPTETRASYPDLAFLNDTMDFTFEMIARTIEMAIDPNEARVNFR